MNIGKLVISLDGVIIKEVQITQEKTTLGRRPYNDIVIDNLAISGEHAALQRLGADIFIEDLNSTNGTYINGKLIKRQLLVHNDTIEVGKYKIKYLLEVSANFERTMIIRPPAKESSVTASAVTIASGGISSVAAGIAPGRQLAPSSNFPPRTGGLNPGSGLAAIATSLQPASVKVLNGAAAGRQVNLTKVVTTVGKPGIQVASITKRPAGYVLAHVEGAQRPTVNGNALLGDSVHLKNGDVIELAGTQMEFIQLPL